MDKMQRLLEIMAHLRHPEDGCPWDREQSFLSILPYTLEETYEVADAIERNDMHDLKEELGDLLFQIVFYAQMAKEQGDFEFQDVVEAVSQKLVERHPHVFADAQISSAEDQTLAWEQHKVKERARKADAEQRPPSALDNIPVTLPALARAAKLQRRAARVGFDWPEISQVLDKIEEEVSELRQALAAGGAHEEMEHEIGDLMFACVNLARFSGVDTELALRGINRRFETRFRRVETLASENGQALPGLALEVMEGYWEQAKREEVLAKTKSSAGQGDA